MVAQHLQNHQLGHDLALGTHVLTALAAVVGGQVELAHGRVLPDVGNHLRCDGVVQLLGLGGQREVLLLVRHLGHVGGHVGVHTGLPGHHLGQLLVQQVQVLVPLHRTEVVAHHVLGVEGLGVSEVPGQDELHDGVDLLGPVLQRGSGQGDPELRVQSLDRLRPSGLEPLDRGGLVQHHALGSERGDHLPVVDDRLVATDDVVGVVLLDQGVLLSPLVRSTVEHHAVLLGGDGDLLGFLPLPAATDLALFGLHVGELSDGLRPLVLQPGGDHDQCVVDGVLGQKLLDGCDSDQGLTEPHLVGDQAVAEVQQEVHGLVLVRK